MGISLVKGSEVILTQTAYMINNVTELCEFYVTLNQELKDDEFIIIKEFGHTLLFGKAPDGMDTTGFITDGRFQAKFDTQQTFSVEKISNGVLIKDLVFKLDNQELNEKQNIVYNTFAQTLRLDDFLAQLQAEQN